MILTVDIGNTNIVMGGYCAGGLAFSTRIATSRTYEADQYALELSGILNLHEVDKNEITGAILSSVVPQITETVMSAIERFAGVRPILFSAELPMPMGIRAAIERPAELGVDLLAGACGAAALVPLPAIVIDMGTATKLTALDKDGVILGVSILPGVFISLNALTSGASALGGIALNAPAHAIGKNTVESMQSGIVLGTASLLDGMIDRFAAEMGEVKSIVSTGGAAPCIVPHCKHTVQNIPTLILSGLYAVWECINAEG